MKTAASKVTKFEILQGEKQDAASFYETLFENASDAIIVINLNNLQIANVNQAMLQLSGYVRHEITGMNVSCLFPPSTEVPTHSHGFGSKQVSESGFFEDIVLKAKDGYLRFISLSVKVLKVAGTNLAMCIMRDVAEKKNMERDLITKHSELRSAYLSLEKANAELKSMQETLIQSGKLAALGELAAGIAHELNQPLTAVMGFAQEAKVAVKTGKVQDLDSYFDEIVGGAKKMEKIISHLRNFTRKSTEDFKWTSLNEVIEESLLMLDKQLTSRGIKVEKKFDNDLPKLFCNPFQLEQVFINLATNARDAIESKHEGKGVISISTRDCGNNMVEVRYRDNGCGIADAARGKIFNPFFTTKEVGKGMGLGLSISYGILAKINASIVVESTVGQGTTFILKIPIDYRNL